MKAYMRESLPPESQLIDISIDCLKDDESWRRLTALLLDSAISEQQLEMVRARLIARLRQVSDEAADDT